MRAHSVPIEEVVSDMAELRALLGDEQTLAGCAAVCCDHLVALGHELPSLYFERSGRLRCYASRGYWQVLDGFPPEFGVIAATVRTGQPHLVDTSASDVYLEAAPDVVAEVCVPIVHRGHTIGAINIESKVMLDESVLRTALDVAGALGERVEQLGGLPEPTGWRLLADESARLTQLDSAGDIAEAAICTAVRLSAVKSAALVNRTGVGDLDPIVATGPMADELRAMSASSLAEINRWVDGPRSCYTMGRPDGHGFTGHDTLRLSSVGTLIVVALRAHGEQLGFLLVADEHSVLPAAELVEQLEVLGTLVAGALKHALQVEALIDIGRRDPLTGLGHTRAFADRLDAIAQGQARHAVLSIDIDHFKQVNDERGHDAGDAALRTVAQAMNEALRMSDCLFRTGGDEFAVIVPVRDEGDAMRIAERVQRAARRVGQPVSIGIALAAPGEPDHRGAFARADAALYSAKQRGRDGTALAHSRLSV
jgi:diguanylate cyclase (GGDEF)-like protein